jgi:Holliday junction DNA helicase RuvB
MSNNDNALRPITLSDIIGLTDTKRRVKVSIDAAKARNESLGHVLIDGSKGLGKTTLALSMAHEIGTNLQIANAATIKSPKELFQVLRDLETRDVFFIDEIHSLPRPVEEFLFTAMEDFRIDIPMGRTNNIVSVDLNPFTLIGATTHVGKVSPPLRDRFRFKEQLNPYSDEDIAKITTINARKLGCTIKDDAAMAIAVRSRSTPRISINNLYWCRDFSQLHGSKDLTLEYVEGAMKDKGIDEMGLFPIDRKYLKILHDDYAGGAAGKAVLAYALLIAEETLETDVEPFLTIKGFITRTSKGRCLTDKGYKLARTLKVDLE